MQINLHGRGTAQEKTGYVQVFRSGVIEAVDTSVLEADVLLSGEERSISSPWHEHKLMGAINRFLRLLRNIGVQPPVFTMISMLGVLGYSLHSPQSWRRHFSFQVERDALILPEVQVETYQYDIDVLLRPIFDMLYQSAGLPRSPQYQENGRWLHKDFSRPE